MKQVTPAPTRDLVKPVLDLIMKEQGEIKFAYKVEEVAKLLSISRSQVHAMWATGKLPTINFETEEGEGPRRMSLGQLLDYICNRELEARRAA